MTMTEARLEYLPDAGFLIGKDRIRSREGSGGTFQHVYAATGKPTKEVAIPGAQEMADAVAAAREAFPGWRFMRRDRRRRCFLRLALLIREHNEEFAQIGTIDTGMPIAIMRRATVRCADSFEYFGGWTDKIGGEVMPSWPLQALNYTLNEPYGVVGMMLPFNVPMQAFAVTVPGALAAGNCVVVKPSILAPFSMLRLGELALEAGFPPGVLNVLPGDGKAGEALVRTPGVNKVLFMGSGKSAKFVLHAAADRLIPVTTELGGKSANLIFDDVDVDKAVMLAVAGGIAAVGGQGCALGTRLLVQSTIYPEFLDQAVKSAASLAFGDPVRDDTQLGPVVNNAAADRIAGVVERAVAEGQGRLITGGHRGTGEFAGGAYFEPTLFADVPNTAPIAADEIFGPVLTISPFDTEEEAVRLANESSYGLNGWIQTKDAKRLHRIAERLEVGSVWANLYAGLPVSIPFGGTKESGFGRLGGVAAIREMTRPKDISLTVYEDDALISDLDPD